MAFRFKGTSGSLSAPPLSCLMKLQPWVRAGALCRECVMARGVGFEKRPSLKALERGRAMSDWLLFSMGGVSMVFAFLALAMLWRM